MIPNYLSKLALILLLSNTMIAQSNAEQELPRKISTDFTLKENTTYVVTDTIQLSNDATLNIREGVILKSLKNTKVMIVIDSGSKLIASGSYDNPIKASSLLSSKEQPMIVIKSSRMNSKNSLESNYFYYKSIENPTVLMSSQPSSSKKNKRT